VADLLLELFSEEIPARMQRQAGEDLARLMRTALQEQGLAFDGLETLAGPRRLTLFATGLPLAQPDRTEERKGPRSNAPEQALAGFLRSTGLNRDQLVEREGVLFATFETKGRQTADILAEIIDKIIRTFPWPKSMRWGAGTLRWVRPLQRILCLLDGRIVPFEIDGIVSGDVTEGHRFMGDPAPFRVLDAADYRQKLEARHVVLAAAERKQRILDGARSVCAARGLELVEDEGLLDEVSGLAEWPTPLLGDMDPAFLSLPPEVIRTSMRTHQKYFAVRAPGQPGLAPHFVTVANIAPLDGGKLILAGNAKVLSGRLSDARFFWSEDRKAPLDSRLDKLKGVTFHAKLGTMFQRVDRIEALARRIAPLVGADQDMAARAARLTKADLGTGMVGEFPELQGIMGGYYARGLEPDAVADAIRDHYKPQGPGDTVPAAPVTVAVALADKIDTLTGFFSIDEKPTGSRDPFALRRAALGVIRLILTNRIRVGLRSLFPEGVQDDLTAFFADRLKVMLREEGKRHDLVDAVFALGDDDLVRVVARIEALTDYFRHQDIGALLAGYNRAANILKAEARKGPLPEGLVSVLPGAPIAEMELIRTLVHVAPLVEAAVRGEQFVAAMSALGDLRQPIDAFFEQVLVNDLDSEIRDNRLKLLNQLRDTFHIVADFSLIGG
jgi:glycyl-tRNA synthetase beta chain